MLWWVVVAYAASCCLGWLVCLLCLVVGCDDELTLFVICDFGVLFGGCGFVDLLVGCACV